MAGNNLQSSDNIFVDFDCQNIVLVDPNKTQNLDGTVRERQLHHENLVMYANLEARVVPRTKLAVGAPINDAIQNVELANINFLRPGGKTTLKNDYLEYITSQQTKNDKGTVQPAQGQLNVQNKTDEFYKSQNDPNSYSTGLLGIESIRVKNTRSATPTVDVVLIDTQGRALFEKGENSEYAAFFNLPYPVFYLTMKGFFGKAIRYQLILQKFSAAFEGNTGNYRISLSFYSYKYSILAETQVGVLYALPNMYTSDYRITATSPDAASVQASQASVGNTTSPTTTLRTTKGYGFIRDVYKKYKSLGLVPEDLPELTFQQLFARLQTLEKNILEGFGQEDFSPLSDVQSYTKLVESLYKDVLSSSPSSWFSQFINKEKTFVYKYSDGQNDENLLVYLFNDNTNSNEQTRTDAYNKLQQIIVSYKTQLQKNPTLGINGSFIVEGVKNDTTEVKSLRNLTVNDSLKSLDAKGVLVEDTFRKAINPDDIDWDETYILRNKVKGTQAQIEALKVSESVFFRPQSLQLNNQPVQYPTYNFIFDGPNNFEGIINKIEDEISKSKEKVVLALSAALEKKVEGPNGMGFRPSIRNIMAMIFASVEAHYRLMDDVHTQAWSQRFNKKRRQAILSNTLSSASSDTKDNTPTTTSPSVADIPIYPWPQYLTNTNSPDGEPFELKYPGDSGERSKTGANDFVAWPEVEFVEEYIRGLSRTADTPPAPTTDGNESKSIRRLSVNAVEYPITNAPYSDYQAVKYLFEIYERVLLATYWDRLSKPGAKKSELYKSLSDMEVQNIQASLLSASPSLTKILKNIAFSPLNYLGVLRESSNQGTGPSWQQLIRGIFTSDYLRTITEKDYGILPSSYLKPGADTTSQNVESFDKISEYIKSSISNETDITDLYPFASNAWNKNNLSSYQTTENVYSTTKSLYLNDTQRFITNFQSDLTQNQNRPFTSGGFLSTTSPSLLNSNGQEKNYNSFYTERRINKEYLPTEGPVNYDSNSGNLIAEQTTSMLNTPFFLNSLMSSIEDAKQGTSQPYKAPAYLFLNSLPLSTLREKYKDVSPTLDTDLDYIFASLTKFGGVHKLPQAWILKIGSIWHRYKTWKETGFDFLQSSWNNVDIFDYYDPNNQSLSTEYDFTNQKGSNVKIVAQQDYSPTNASLGVNTVMNMGFYPKVMNNIYFMMTGQNLFTNYSDSEMDAAVALGMNVGDIDFSSIKLPQGFDTASAKRTLTFKTWYTSFDSGTLPQFNPSKQNKTIVVPSFATQANQVYQECFSDTPTGTTMNFEPKNNRAIFDGSFRTFWQSPNFGYFELPSISYPQPDEYIKEFFPNQKNTEAFILGDYYNKIEDLFGVFKKDILDEFENKFLTFCSSPSELEVDDFTFAITNSNFPLLFQELISVDKVNRTLNYEDYLNLVSNSQTKKIGETIQSFLNFDIAFKFGNPSNFDRKLFGSFTTRPTNKVFDGYTWNAYVNNTVPSSTGTITLAQSQTLFPITWAAMYTHVGFGTQAGMVYTDKGSYYTDFFITMDVEFNETNVINFAPLIKIFATQKLLNNGQYTSADFLADIDEYYQNGDEYISEILTQLFFSLQKNLPNVEEVTEKQFSSALDGDETKLELWETFKAFNDKWIAGVDFNERTLFQDVIFLDRANRDIGDVVLCDVFKLRDYFSGTTSMNTRIIDFVSKIIADTKFQMMPMPAYVNFWGLGDVQNGQRPRTESSEDMANSLFGTFLDVDYRDSQPKLVCYFVGKPSEHLSMKENQDYRFKTDAFKFDCGGNQPLVDKLDGKTNWAQSNKVVGFNVDFGIRNQTIFYSIQLDQNQAAATAESNRVITDMSLQAGGRSAVSQSTGLFNFYKTRSYECRVESMGNVMIQPTMYFNLQHVPMFYGPYMVQSVEHVIDSGNFRTYFTGIRMPVYSIPLITKQIVSLNNNLLSELVQKINRLKETDSSNISKNVISVGNSIQTNTSFVAASPVQCINDMLLANQKYRNYTGIETTRREITFADFATLIKNNVTDRRARGMVFYTAYLNGHDENKLFAFDYDLGGTPFGGSVFDGINYGGRETYFTRQYGCRTSPNGSSTPYAVFPSFKNSIDFIETYYLNPSAGGRSILNSDPRYKWDTKADFIGSLALVWSEWWPTRRWNTEEEGLKYIEANKSTFESLKKAAAESVEKCISLGIISF